MTARVTVIDYREPEVEEISFSSEEEWKQFRSTGIGASEAAVVLGISPWQSPLSLYFQKRGEIPDQFENKQMSMGKKLEALVIEMYAEQTGRAVYPNKCIYRIPKKPHILATPDAFTDENGGVEAKTAVYAGVKKWDDEVPIHYQAQAQHQMLVLGWNWVDFPVLKSGVDFEIYRVERDEKVIRDIEAAVDRFWTQVQEGIAPEADGHEATSKALAAFYGSSDPDSVLECDPAVLEIVESLERVKAKQKDLEESRAFFENRLKALLGKHEIALVDGKKAFSWKVSERTGIDVDGFRKAFPRASKRFQKTTSVRTFRIHKMEGK